MTAIFKSIGLFIRIIVELVSRAVRAASEASAPATEVVAPSTRGDGAPLPAERPRPYRRGNHVALAAPLLCSPERLGMSPLEEELATARNPSLQ